MASSVEDPRVQRRIDDWKGRLIDLSRRNRLVYFQPTGSAHLFLVEPEADVIFERLVAQAKPFGFWLPPDADSDEAPAHPAQRPSRQAELVCAAPDGGLLRRKDLERLIKNLFRRSYTDYQERGVRVLYVAFGLLSWPEAQTGQMTRAPLILCPVQLNRETPSHPFVLSAAEEDVVVNPALKVKLRSDLNVELPDLPSEWESTALSDYLAFVTADLGTLGCTIEPSAVLGLFLFNKLVMYQDLEANASLIGGHPLIRALCGETVALAANGDIPADTELDAIQVPESTFQILDADSSQQVCIQAALRGHSLVLQGPPGTGKSQTIANIIAEFIANGKSVLFVSEKMAALEVVFKRLQRANLGDFCLELHSHKANKREVVAELKRCLDESIVPKRLPTPADFDGVRRLRERLNGYVHALHVKREPLGESIYDVLSKLSTLDGYPLLAVEGSAVATLDGPRLAQWDEWFNRLSLVWAVAEEGAAFPWYGCRQAQFGAEDRSWWADVINDCTGTLGALRAEAESYCRSLDLVPPATFGDVDWLIRVGDLLSDSPGPAENWLTSPHLERLVDDAQRQKAYCTEYWRLVTGLRERYGDAIFDMPTDASERFKGSMAAATALLNLRGDEIDRLLPQAHDLALFVKQTAALLSSLESLGASLAARLGFDEGDFSLERVSAMAHLAQLSAAPDRPEGEWFDPQRIRDVRDLIERARPIYAEHNRLRMDLLERYDGAFLELDIEGLLENFSRFSYRTLLRVISPGYRRDRKMILRTARVLELPPSTVEDLLQAREVLRLRHQIEDGHEQVGRLLGRYDRGFDTDFDAVGRALTVADEALGWAKSMPVPQRTMEALALGSPPDHALSDLGARVLAMIDRWQATAPPGVTLLPWDHLPHAGLPILQASLSVVVRWIGDLSIALDELGAVIAALDACAKGTPPRAHAAILADLTQVDAVRAVESAMAEDAERLRTDFAGHYRAENTNWDTVLARLAWARHLRDLAGDRRLSATFLRKAAAGGADAPSTAGLIKRREDVVQHLRRLTSRFAASDSYWGGIEAGWLLDEVGARLAVLGERLDDLGSWTDFVSVTARLASAGLGTLAAQAQAKAIPATSLVATCRKAVLSAWVRAMVEYDEHLAEFRGPAHEQLIAQFNELDRKLVQLASNAVIERCDARRPRAVRLQTGDSEVAILRREAAKRRRILPVRHLFERIPNTLLRLKPCLLMSPLSVSQFLHPDRFQFDLVIFDEASQIFTEDAIGCIYRGRQVIVAGDSKQLPPTNFFSTLENDDENEDDVYLEATSGDFNSVLDECGAVLPDHANLFLRWHYRSRHEALIAFSNQQFYHSRLITFPAARARVESLGVAFHYVADGVYDRGRKRTNAAEIEVVVDLIIEHFARFPQKSLGVVAFSQAQMAGIEDQLEMRRRDHPDLDRFFGDDRLEGFFVKNLENVQGDERDVIIFSIGYGRDRYGHLSMNFGPLNKQGGERRLNVAITRAREKVVVVSSIKASDFDLEGVQSAGVLNLWRYLEYAERGQVMEHSSPVSQDAEESVLEDEVAAAIRRLGYDTVARVGCGGFRLDIGVVDPADPGRFVLGVVCDGPAYRSAATARDRDRIREEVLRSLGWHIHHVWSPDWIARRHLEVRRLQSSIEEACGQRSDEHSPQTRAQAGGSVDTTGGYHDEIERWTRSEADAEDVIPGTVPYERVTLRASRFASRDFHAPENRREQCALLIRLVSGEGPIHIDVAARRLTAAWGLSRTGVRIMVAVEEAVRGASWQRAIRKQGQFLWPAEQKEVKVRTPVDGDPETERAVEHIAPEEIQAAMRLIISHAVGIGVESLITEVARLFGFARTGDRIYQRLLEEYENLKNSGQINCKDDTITLADTIPRG